MSGNHTYQLIPVSYLNAYVYCPRRFYLEYVRGLFEDNEHTIEGRAKHHRVDAKGKEGKAVKKDIWIHRRSVVFSDDQLGITGKLDLMEETANEPPPYPVEYKKGKKPKQLPSVCLRKNVKKTTRKINPFSKDSLISESRQNQPMPRIVSVLMRGLAQNVILKIFNDSSRKAIKSCLFLKAETGVLQKIRPMHYCHLDIVYYQRIVHQPAYVWGLILFVDFTIP